VRRIITLTTDFGARDPFVGAMKGVILSLVHDVHLIDITHEITPQDIIEGAFVLAGAVPYFPRSTIHVAVVDPGVGGDRKGIVIQQGDTIFVGPDNGIFGMVLQKDTPYRAVEIRNPSLIRETVSATFHGRDLFAPAAAHLSKGVNLDAFGPPVERLVELPVSVPQIHGTRMVGRVIHVDRFGNLITNISKERFDLFVKGRGMEVHAGERTLRGIGQTYSAVPPGELIALFGSMEVLEIAINCGNASEVTGLRRGEYVIVERT
jgi:S-adenosylmethionine hydrolase